MKINYTKPAFQPIVLTIESLEELAAITLALGDTSQRDYETAIDDSSISLDHITVADEGDTIYHTLLPILKNQKEIK